MKRPWNTQGLPAESWQWTPTAAPAPSGLIASRHARQVIGVESNREAVRDAIANAKRNGIENAWFACEDAGRFLTRMEQEGQRPDLLFLDPPRGGCSRQTWRPRQVWSPAEW